MKKQNLSTQKKTVKVKREIDPIPRRYCLLTLAFGLIIVAGFLFAARQHFGAINLGIENSQLRKQRDELSTKQRQLKIARELAYSPLELEKAAFKIGMQRTSFSDNTAFENESKTLAQVSKIDIKKSFPIASVASAEPKNGNAQATIQSPIDKSNPFPNDDIPLTNGINRKDGTARKPESKKADLEKSNKDPKRDRRTDTAAKVTSDKNERTEISRYSKL